MATEQSTITAYTGTLAEYLPWLAATVGLWAIASPFVVGGSIGSGTAMLSTVVAGVVIFLFAVVGAYGVRISAELPSGTPTEWAAWIAALAGLWLAVSPFVLSGAFDSGMPMYTTVGAGAIAFVLAAFTGYEQFQAA